MSSVCGTARRGLACKTCYRNEIMRKQFSHYLGMALLFSMGMVLLFKFAPHWMGASNTVSSPVPVTPSEPAFPFLTNLRGSLGIFLLQVIIVVAMSKAMGAIFNLMKLPRVVGEMFAGILLGPSLFGWFSPEVHSMVFPSASLDSLKALSQVGVMVFMFCVGAELDSRLLRKKANTALLVSHFSIFLPFLLGVGVAIVLYKDYASSNVDFKTFSLFMGISMSITAFPVLASIIRERGMGSSALGGAALACAAIDDVTAWFILAGIIAFARAEGMFAAGSTLVAALLYCGTMLWLVKPRIGKLQISADADTGRLMFRIMIFMFFSALVTELIGIHALFGAFLAGVVVSNNEAISRFAAQRIEPFATTILLPLFFCYTGLRTEIGLINDAQDWLICGLVVALATLGKLGGGALAARITGAPWREALSLGALMNTRGLMELVVLNIGLDLGIITPGLFSIMVVMALVTTVMTGPLLSLFQRMPEASAPPSVSPDGLCPPSSLVSLHTRRGDGACSRTLRL